MPNDKVNWIDAINNPPDKQHSPYLCYVKHTSETLYINEEWKGVNYDNTTYSCIVGYYSKKYGWIDGWCNKQDIIFYMELPKAPEGYEKPQPLKIPSNVVEMFKHR